MTEWLTRLLANYLPKGGFLRGASVLAAGTALGQGLVLLASPLLTRLYSPNDFGVLAVFTALLGVLAVIGSLRYELAVPLPEDDGEALSVLVLALLIVMFASVVSGLLVLLLAGPITKVTNTPELRPLLWILPIGVLLTGSYQALNYWVVRMAAFNTIAKTKLAQGLGSVLTQVGLGLSSVGPLGLLAGQIVGQAVGAASLGTRVLQSTSTGKWTVSWHGITRLARRYRRFPMYSTWTALANTFSMQLPALFLPTYFGTAVTGQYALGLRVLQTPMILLGASIAQVFFVRATAAKRDDRLEELVLSVFGNLARIGFPLLGIIAIAAPELFEITFGSAWRGAGVYAQWFAPWLVLQFVSSPLSTLASVLEKQNVETVLLVGLLLARLSTLMIGGAAHDPGLAIALFASVSAIGYLSFLLWNLSLVGLRPGETMRYLAKATLDSIFFLVPVGVGKVGTLALQQDVYVLAGAVISGLVTAAMLIQRLGKRAMP